MGGKLHRPHGKKQFTVNLTYSELSALIEIIDSFEELMGHNPDSIYRDIDKPLRSAETKLYKVRERVTKIYNPSKVLRGEL